MTPAPAAAGAPDEQLVNDVTNFIWRRDHQHTPEPGPDRATPSVRGPGPVEQPRAVWIAQLAACEQIRGELETLAPARRQGARRRCPNLAELTRTARSAPPAAD